MNDIDLNTLRLFAEITLQYLTEDNEFGITQLWQHGENARKLQERMNKLAPIVDAILHHSI